VRLHAPRDDIARALRDDGAALVVVGLVQEAAARIDVAPQVQRRAAADLAHAGDQRLGVHHLRDVVAPGQRVEVLSRYGMKAVPAPWQA
jgi:ParB-like chromosome segregation protein Spo0J